ncbi:hypothetical protein MXB_3836, partial [Myxobolus squamalis]
TPRDENSVADPTLADKHRSIFKTGAPETLIPIIGSCSYAQIKLTLQHFQRVILSNTPFNTFPITLSVQLTIWISLDYQIRSKIQASTAIQNMFGQNYRESVDALLMLMG